ncbi:MAG: restriction endonuclease [Betaproteobacteria bacterium]|nr:restriction endonuclease [Betaproteobacteria bacterium]
MAFSLKNYRQAILDSEAEGGGQENIKVRHDEQLIDRFGVSRQFDVLWEYEQAGIRHKTIIECKDYSSSVSIDKVDALCGKLVDFPGVRGIIATTKGYQSGAKEKAKNNNIELLCIREQNDSDWQTSEGEPLIRGIHLNITLDMPIRILEFVPVVDGAWIEENTNLNTTEPVSVGALTNQIFIDDKEANERYSLHDLSQKIKIPEGVSEEEPFEVIKKFPNAFLECPNMRLKLIGYKMKCVKPETIEEKSEIDFSRMLIGVVEYLNQNKKKMIMDNGVVKDIDLEVKK